MPRRDLREQLSNLYEVSLDQVVIFGLRTCMGGNKSTGFAFVYNSLEAVRKSEPRYRLARNGLAQKRVRRSRQNRTFQPLTRCKTFLAPVDLNLGIIMETLLDVSVANLSHCSRLPFQKMGEKIPREGKS